MKTSTYVQDGVISKAELENLFAKQKKHQYQLANQSISERKRKLKALLKAVLTTYRQEIRDALHADFGKSQAESDLTEIFPVTSEIKHALKNLKRWSSKKAVSTPLSLLGSRSWIHYEPKGVCLIIAPWNFPINLVFGPLVSAIAAGNSVVIKPSEYTPNASAISRKIVEAIFSPEEVALVEGGIQTSTDLLALPFNHIFFTGAPSIGKIVMAAAAKNLASVTLELGGKSPVIVDETANIKQAAKRIIWGKFTNNGQICIAPDYLYVHQSKKEALITEMKKVLNTFYGDSPNDSTSLTKVVNSRHLQRVRSYLDDAVHKGARVLTGGKTNESDNGFEPTLVTEVSKDSELMKNEIFGPILPIYSYSSISEVIDYIQANEKPLALYIYSSKKSNIDHIMNNTRAGGTCINNNAVHFFNGNLPFGGTNNSGIGKAHGQFGFEEFSNARSVYKQLIPSALEQLMPPYNSAKEKLIELTVKYF